MKKEAENFVLFLIWRQTTLVLCKKAVKMSTKFLFTPKEVEALMHHLELHYDELFDKHKAANYRKKHHDSWCELVSAVRLAEPNLRDGMGDDDLQNHIYLHIQNNKKQGCFSVIACFSGKIVSRSKLSTFKLKNM